MLSFPASNSIMISVQVSVLVKFELADPPCFIAHYDVENMQLRGFRNKALTRINACIAMAPIACLDHCGFSWIEKILTEYVTSLEKITLTQKRKAFGH